MYEKVDFLNLSDLVCSNYKKNNIISEFYYTERTEQWSFHRLFYYNCEL